MSRFALLIQSHESSLSDVTCFMDWLALTLECMSGEMKLNFVDYAYHSNIMVNNIQNIFWMWTMKWWITIIYIRNFLKKDPKCNSFPQKYLDKWDADLNIFLSATDSAQLVIAMPCTVWDNQKFLAINITSLFLLILFAKHKNINFSSIDCIKQYVTPCIMYGSGKGIMKHSTTI